MAASDWVRRLGSLTGGTGVSQRSMVMGLKLGLEGWVRAGLGSGRPGHVSDLHVSTWCVWAPNKLGSCGRLTADWGYGAP